MDTPREHINIVTITKKDTKQNESFEMIIHSKNKILSRHKTKQTKHTKHTK